jgi:membrane associated rhomboid family serine protease
LLEALGALRLGIGGGEAGIAFWAHVGGFVGGMILMPLVSRPPPPAPPEDDWHASLEHGFP